MTRSRIRRRCFTTGGTLLFVCSTVLVGCATSSPKAADTAVPAVAAELPAGQALAATWGGPLDGTDAFVALASNGSELLAYVCDGASIATWFKADDGSDGVDLTAGDIAVASGQFKLSASLTTDGANGTVTLADGSVHDFVGGRLSGDAGLYRSEETVDGGSAIGGWVVLPTGELRGALVGPNANFAGLTALRSAARLLVPDTPY